MSTLDETVKKVHDIIHDETPVDLSRPTTNYEDTLEIPQEYREMIIGAAARRASGIKEE